MNGKIQVILLIMAIALTMSLLPETNSKVVNNKSFQTKVSAFQATKVKLSLQPSSAVFNVHNMAPGDYSVGKLNVQNQGNEKFYYTVTSLLTDGDQPLYDILTVRISNRYGDVYIGSLKALNAISSLEPYTDETMNITVYFPYTADNSFQGKNCTVSFLFTTYQTPPANIPIETG